jgi:hypothetical protein
MAVCCQTLTLGALSSCSALSMLVGALFKKISLFLNTPRVYKLCRYEKPTNITYAGNKLGKWENLSHFLPVSEFILGLLFIPPILF